ncbi:hypothetical protein EDB81DRAFT_617406, partial [Dactylonectria macrodidyma]
KAEGARHGLRHARHIDPIAQIHICIDNTCVIQGLLGDAPNSSQEAFLNTHWAPGHQGIVRNEQADRLANAGTKLLADP